MLAVVVCDAKAILGCESLTIRPIRSSSMLKTFILPTLVVGALSYGVLGYGGYRLLMPSTETDLELQHALEGDIPAQKHTASCYSHGPCSGFAQAPVIGCAWRQVIAEETGHAADAEHELEEACRDLGPSLAPVIADAKRDIESRLALAKLRAHAAHKT